MSNWLQAIAEHHTPKVTGFMYSSTLRLIAHFPHSLQLDKIRRMRPASAYRKSSDMFNLPVTLV